MTADTEHEEHYESIPWDALVTDDARRRRRWLTLLAGGVAVAGIVFVMTRALSGPSAVPVALERTDQTEASTVPSVTTGPSPADQVAPIPSPPIEGGTERDIGEFAAWFVADYFTVDGTDIARRAVEERLPEGIDLPPADPELRSFVESAVPLSVESVGDGRHRVVVLVRYLVAPDGGDYRRPDPRGVEVMVDAGDEGLGIVDLPGPVSLPDPVRMDLDTTTVDEIPEHIADAAIAEAGAWGFPTGELTAGRIGDSWRVVVSVDDEAGFTLPIAVMLDENGNRE